MARSLPPTTKVSLVGNLSEWEMETVSRKPLKAVWSAVLGLTATSRRLVWRVEL